MTVLASLSPSVRYVGLVLILLGFLLQWPTILTLVMFPLLVVMYERLAHAEEVEAARAFESDYARCAAKVPARFPRLGRREVEQRPA